MPTPPPLLTYEQVADRIEAALGTRPAISTLRTASSGKAGIVAEMPKPYYPRHGPRSPLFAEPDIAKWLENHPWQRRDRLVAAIEAATDSTLPTAVRSARADGVSWRRITAAVTKATGAPVSQPTAIKRYS